MYDAGILKQEPDISELMQESRLSIEDLTQLSAKERSRIRQRYALLQESRLSIEDLTQLSAKERSRIRQRYALHRRYETAVSLYADTDASVREIAATCGESEHALRAYLRRYWRELMLRRYGIETEGKDAQEVSFYTADGQSCLAHRKYKEAVQACDSIRYIDLNVSQVARKFGVNATALANGYQ